MASCPNASFSSIKLAFTILCIITAKVDIILIFNCNFIVIYLLKTSCYCKQTVNYVYNWFKYLYYINNPKILWQKKQFPQQIKQ